MNVIRGHFNMSTRKKLKSFLIYIKLILRLIMIKKLLRSLYREATEVLMNICRTDEGMNKKALSFGKSFN